MRTHHRLPRSAKTGSQKYRAYPQVLSYLSLGRDKTLGDGNADEWQVSVIGFLDPEDPKATTAPRRDRRDTMALTHRLGERCVRARLKDLFFVVSAVWPNSSSQVPPKRLDHSGPSSFPAPSGSGSSTLSIPSRQGSTRTRARSGVDVIGASRTTSLFRPCRTARTRKRSTW